MSWKRILSEEGQAEDLNHIGSGTGSQRRNYYPMVKGGPLTSLGSSPQALPLKILLHCDFPVPTEDSLPSPEPTEPSKSRHPRPTKEPSTPNAKRSNSTAQRRRSPCRITRALSVLFIIWETISTRLALYFPTRRDPSLLPRLPLGELVVDPVHILPVASRSVPLEITSRPVEPLGLGSFGYP